MMSIPSEEDKQKALAVVRSCVDSAKRVDCDCEDLWCYHWADKVAEPFATALTAARAETWEEAIAEVRNVVKGWRSDVDESWNERPDLSFEAADKVAGAIEIVTALEAAAGSKTKVFSEDEQKNLGR